MTDASLSPQQNGNSFRWSYTPESFEVKNSVRGQHVSDMQIWDSTLFAEEGPGYNSGTLSQQRILRRHFLAMAYFGVNHLNKASGATTPLEMHRPGVPLAAIPSHGGRFAYEINDAYSSSDAMSKFKNVLFTGFPDKNPTVHQDQSMADRRSLPGDPGLFARVSTHGQKIEETSGGLARKWQEIKLKTGERGHIGMNFPLGGVGNYIYDKNRKLTRIGTDGHAASSGKKPFQLGSALFAFSADKKNSSARLMVGFEGTAPHKKNQLGASHGFRSTVFGAVFGMKKYKNHRGLTGQLKGEHANMPGGLGAIGSTISEKQFDSFCTLIKGVRILENDKAGREKLRQDFRDLLSSTTSGERQAVLTSIARSAYKVSQRNTPATNGSDHTQRLPDSNENQRTRAAASATDEASDVRQMVRELGYNPAVLARYIARYPTGSSTTPLTREQTEMQKKVSEVANLLPATGPHHGQPPDNRSQSQVMSYTPQSPTQSGARRRR
ncbi:hypothetical protein [Streptomyces mirabilis]